MGDVTALAWESRGLLYSDQEIGISRPDARRFIRIREVYFHNYN